MLCDVYIKDGCPSVFYSSSFPSSGILSTSRSTVRHKILKKKTPLPQSPLPHSHCNIKKKSYGLQYPLGCARHHPFVDRRRRSQNSHWPQDSREARVEANHRRQGHQIHRDKEKGSGNSPQAKAEYCRQNSRRGLEGRGDDQRATRS